MMEPLIPVIAEAEQPVKGNRMRAALLRSKGHVTDRRTIVLDGRR